MKKLVKGFVFATSILLLASCGKSAKEEFATEMYGNSGLTTYNAVDYDISMQDFKMEAPNAENNVSGILGMVSTQLKDMKISGDFLLDGDKAAKVKLKVKAFQQEIPIEVITDSKKSYVSGESYVALMNFASSFGAGKTLDATKQKELTGKYIETDLQKTTSKQDLAEVLKGIKGGQGNKLMKEYVQTLDEKTFKKEKNTISHTFTKKELLGYKKYVEKHGSKEDKKSVKELFTSIEKLDKVEAATTIDTKTKELEMVIAVSDNAEGSKLEMKLKIAVKPSKSKEKVKIPAKNQILSSEAATSLVGDASKVDSGTSTTDTETKLSDEEFNKVYASLESNKEGLTQEMIDEIKKESGQYLTEEQLKRLDGLVQQ